MIKLKLHLIENKRKEPRLLMINNVLVYYPETYFTSAYLNKMGYRIYDFYLTLEPVDMKSDSENVIEITNPYIHSINGDYPMTCIAHKPHRLSEKFQTYFVDGMYSRDCGKIKYSTDERLFVNEFITKIPEKAINLFVTKFNQQPFVSIDIIQHGNHFQFEKKAFSSDELKQFVNDVINEQSIYDTDNIAFDSSKYINTKLNHLQSKKIEYCSKCLDNNQIHELSDSELFNNQCFKCRQ